MWPGCSNNVSGKGNKPGDEFPDQPGGVLPGETGGYPDRNYAENHLKFPDYIISYIPNILVYTGREFPTGEKTWTKQCKCMSDSFTVVGAMVNKLALLRY